MNTKIYASLFRRRDKLVLLGFFVFCLFVVIELTRPNHQGKMESDFLLFILCPAFGLGSLLIEIWNRPLQLRATVLLPGLQRRLFQWHIRVMFAVMLVWSWIIHLLHPQVPFLAALGLSASLTTLPVYLMQGQPARLSGLIWGVIIGINLPAILTSGPGSLILAHVWIACAAGWALLALNLGYAWKHRQPADLMRHLVARSQPTGLGASLAAMWQRISGQKGNAPSLPAWNYAPRGDSLFRRIQAAFQESPSGFWINVFGCSLIILVHPWAAQHAAGYPLGWYRPVFDPGHSGETAGSTFALVIAVVASSLGPGLLRTSQFYPISRRQRFTVAFTASAVGFCCNFLAITGGSVLAGWLVGRWAGLPLPSQPAAEFVTKMAMVVPFMPLMRWGALRLELRQNYVELFLFIAFVAILVIIGQSIVLEWGLRAGIVICLVSIVASQLMYCTALREFYTADDLIQCGPARDVTG